MNTNYNYGNKMNSNSQQNNDYYNQYVTRDSSLPASPQILNDVTPLISDYDDRRQSYSKIQANHIYIFHSEHSRRKLFLRLFFYTIMILTLIGLFTMFLALFISYAYDSDYRYLLFVRRWPPTICKKSDGCRSDFRKFNYWTIHGLWPENTDNTWDQYCSNQNLDPTIIHPIRERMLEVWPNLLIDRSEDSLWEHEWKKHGTCSQMKQFDYFNDTIKLYDEYNFEQIFKNNDIVPRSDRKYSRNMIEQILQQSLKEKGLNVDDNRQNYILNCQEYNSESYLEEIWLCLSFHRPDEQTSYCTMKSTCPDEFYYIGFE